MARFGALGSTVLLVSVSVSALTAQGQSPTFQRTTKRLERGRYLSNGPMHCFNCHADQRQGDGQNLSKSTFSPDAPPKSQVISWKRASTGLMFTTDTVSANGQTSHTETLEKDDGSDGKIVGGAEGRTRSLKRIDARTYEDMDKTNGKTTMTRRLVIAPDGKSATITMTGTNNDGKPVKNVVVFEKQ